MTDQQRKHRSTPEYKEIARISSKKYRSTDEYKAYKKAYRSTPKYQAYRRNHDFIQKFGITIDDYNVLFEQQLGVCAICGQKETFTVRGVVHSLAVDHDHKTGKIRGLLCRNCNQALGLMRDNIGNLIIAIVYLKKNV